MNFSLFVSTERPAARSQSARGTDLLPEPGSPCLKARVLRLLGCTAWLLWTALPAHAQAVVGTVPAGNGAGAVEVNPATNKIYVVNSASDTLTVLDGARGAGVTVAVGHQPTALAINPVTNRIYVANALDGTVTVLDGATNATTTVPVGVSPAAIAVNPVTNKIYVTNYGPEPPYRSPGSRPAYTVTVIDGASNATTTVIVENRPRAVALNPVTNKIYVANFGDTQPNGGLIPGHTVSVIDGVTNVATTIEVGTNPTGIAVNPVTNRIYVTAGSIYGSPRFNVTVIDGATQATVTLALDQFPGGVLVNPMTNKVYVQGSMTMMVIDGATQDLATIPMDSPPLDIAVNPLTNKVFVTRRDSDTLTVIDGSTQAVATLTGISGGAAIAVNPITNRVYVVNSSLNGGPGNTLTVVDGAVNLKQVLDTGPWVSAPVLNPVTNKLYVSEPGRVKVIDLRAHTTSTVSLGGFPGNPGTPLVNPVTNKIYVAHGGMNGESGGTVTVIDGATHATVAVSVSGQPGTLVLNPVTNKVYIPNIGSDDNTITVMDGATLATSSILVSPGPLAVNPATNRIYVGNTPPPALTILDGESLAATTLPLTGSSPYESAPPFAIAVSPALNKVFVTDGRGRTLFVLDGATNALTPIVADGNVERLAVNPGTDRVYATDFSGSNLLVFDAATHAQVARVPVGLYPQTIAVNSVTNRIYTFVERPLNNPMVVLDGMTNGTQTIDVGWYPYALTLNPLTNQVYMVDYFGPLWSLDVDGARPTPVTIAASGVVDHWTVANDNLYATTDPSPSFKATVTNAFSTSAAYEGANGLSDPAPTALYHWVDDGGTGWEQAARTSAAGANPAEFTITLPPTGLGVHTLYLVATYGDEGGAVSGHSPSLSHLQALPFFITQPTPPGTRVSLDPDRNGPYTVGQEVTFTAVGHGASGYQYRFYLHHGNDRTLVQDYSPVATWSIPADLEPGGYRLEVWVRTPNSTQDKDASANRAFLLRTGKS